MIFALARRALDLARRSTPRCSRARAPPSMLFMILIGALMFAEFVNITTMPDDLKSFVSRFEREPDHGGGGDHA